MLEEDNQSNNSPEQLVNRRNVLATGAATGLLGLSGCLFDSSSGNGTDDGPIRLGVPSALSGPFAYNGENVLNGTELAVKHFNEEGGLDGRKVETVTGDTETDPQAAVELVNRFIDQDNIDLLSGGVASSVNVAIAGVAEENEIPYIGGTSSIDINREACNAYSWGASPDVFIQWNTLINYLNENKSVDSVYLVLSDYAWGHNVSDLAAETLPDLGIEIEGEAFPAFGSTDYSDSISKAISSDADTLIYALWGQDNSKFSNQLLQFDAQEEFDTFGSVLTNLPVFDAMEDEIVPYLTAGINYHWTLDTEANSEFVDAYREEYSEVPASLSGVQYGATIEMLRAARSAGTVEGDAVAAEMEGWEPEQYYKGGEALFRACDHRVLSTHVLGEGKSVDERNHPKDYLDITATPNAASDRDLAAPCNDVCEGPFW